MLLDDAIIVLARPAEPGNIGAVCRAMMNMGLSRLRIVPDRDIPLTHGVEETIRARAVHAGGVWNAAEIFPTLEQAVADIPLVIGTTRRTGRRRKAHSQSAAEAAAYLKRHPGRAAIVFGNERTGLDDGELRCCNLAAHIPANPAFPSLNLSHAVQIFCYELRMALCGADGARTGRRLVPLAQEETALLVRSIQDALGGAGFYRQPGREEQGLFLRDIFARAALTKREGEYLAGLFAKAVRLERKRSAAGEPRGKS